MVEDMKAWCAEVQGVKKSDITTEQQQQRSLKVIAPPQSWMNNCMLHSIEKQKIHFYLCFLKLKKYYLMIISIIHLFKPNVSMLEAVILKFIF